MYKIIRPKSREEWLEERTKGIGSSEVATILGVNPYETRLQLWRRKLGIDPPKEENEAMEMGHLLEDAVAQKWEKETGNKIIASSKGDWLMVDVDKPYLRVSPDRTYWIGNKLKGIVECKSTMMDIEESSFPQSWFLQVMYQLGVSGYKEGYIAWLKKGRYFGTKKIVFDADVYKWMVEEIDKFWKVNICGRVEPEIEDSNDILIKYPVHEEGKFIEADSELIEACAELKMIKDQMKSLSQTKDDLEEKIKIRMADAEKVLCKGVTLVTWKAAKESKKFDEKLFKAENEDLYENYTRMVVGSRRFVVK